MIAMVKNIRIQHCKRTYPLYTCWNKTQASIMICADLRMQWCVGSSLSDTRLCARNITLLDGRSFQSSTTLIFPLSSSFSSLLFLIFGCIWVFLVLISTRSSLFRSPDTSAFQTHAHNILSTFSLIRRRIWLLAITIMTIACQNHTIIWADTIAETLNVHWLIWWGHFLLNAKSWIFNLRIKLGRPGHLKSKKIY